ncbi:hypothetical protein Tco_0944849 [Tanacetum coccineum]
MIFVEPLLSPPSLLPESSPTLTSDVIRSLNMRTKDVVKFSLWWSSDDLDYSEEKQEVASWDMNFLTSGCRLLGIDDEKIDRRETSYIEITMIAEEVTSHSSFFRDNIHCTRREGISPLLKCTSTIRQLACDYVLDF